MEIVAVLLNWILLAIIPYACYGIIITILVKNLDCFYFYRSKWFQILARNFYYMRIDEIHLGFFFVLLCMAGPFGGLYITYIFRIELDGYLTTRKAKQQELRKKCSWWELKEFGGKY